MLAQVQAAEKDRSQAAEDLTEAIRQAERYLSGAKPSKRLIKQRMDKVTEKEEELKRAHFFYCQKGDFQLDSDDARNFISERIDKSTDCVDQCMLKII